MIQTLSTLPFETCRKLRRRCKGPTGQWVDQINNPNARVGRDRGPPSRTFQREDRGSVTRPRVTLEGPGRQVDDVSYDSVRRTSSPVPGYTPRYQGQVCSDRLRSRDSLDKDVRVPRDVPFVQRVCTYLYQEDGFSRDLEQGLTSVVQITSLGRTNGLWTGVYGQVTLLS